MPSWSPIGAGSGEVGGDFFDGSGDVDEVFGAVGAEGADLLGGADGGVDDGAFAGDELEVEAHGGEGEQEVGEDDGGVDAEALGCGDGDFGGDFGGAADFEQGVVLADGHVLGHVAAGLAEEPDGGAVDGAAEAGTNETAAGWGRISAGLRCGASLGMGMLGQEKDLPFERSIRGWGFASGPGYCWMPCESVSRLSSVFEAEGELLDDGVGEDFAGDALDFGLGGGWFRGHLRGSAGSTFPGGRRRRRGIPYGGEHRQRSALGIEHGSFKM